MTKFVGSVLLSCALALLGPGCATDLDAAGKNGEPQQDGRSLKSEHGDEHGHGHGSGHGDGPSDGDHDSDDDSDGDSGGGGGGGDCTACSYHAGDGLLLDEATRTFSVDPARIEEIAGDSGFSGDYNDLTNRPDLSIYATNASLANYATIASLDDVAFTGAYGDLAGLPDLSVYATNASLASYAQVSSLSVVAFTGAYGDLSGRPDLSVYATNASLAGYATIASLDDVAFSGAYGDLSGRPDLTVYATNASLANYATIASLSDVAFSGAYGDLLGRPDLSVYATNASLSNYATIASLSDVAFSGAYGDLSGRPDLSVYATNASLSNYATIASLDDVAFSGAYGDLSGRPDLTVYATNASLSNYATIASLDDVAFSGAYGDLSGRPDLSVYATNASLSNYATIASLSDVAFSGDYNDLDNQAWIDEGTDIRAGIAGGETVVVDQSFTGPLLFCGTSLAALYQSFTAGQSGELAQVSLEISTAKTGVTLTIRNGTGGAGTVLYTATVNLTAGTNTFPITGVTVAAGSVYTIHLAGAPGFNFKCNSGDPYPAGTAGTTVVLTGIDMGFQTFMRTGTPVVVTSAGRIGVKTMTPTSSVDIKSGTIRLRESASPLSTSACNQGEIRWDSGFVYVCIATNTWKRAALTAY